MTNQLTPWLLVAALAAGCGRDATTETTSSERRASAGAEQTALVVEPVTPPEGYQEAAPVAEHLRDVNVYLSAESPTVGIVSSDDADEFPIHVDVENDSDRPLRVDDVLARIAVLQEGETVCEQPDFGSMRLLEETDPVIPAHSARRFVVSLPCGLEETGDYDIIAEILFAGESEEIGVPAPSDPYLAASLRLNVSDLQPPYGHTGPTLAEVPPRDPARIAAIPSDLPEQ